LIEHIFNLVRIYQVKTKRVILINFDLFFKDSVPVILEEDIELSGFYPLLTLPADTLQTTNDTLLVRRIVIF
jgi:hypothetical protein